MKRCQFRDYKKYAKFNGTSISDLIHRSVMERIENEFDLDYENALTEYCADPVTYTLDEVKKFVW